MPANILAALAAVAATASAPVPPGFTMQRTGALTDFAWFEGAWATVQRRMTMEGPRKGQWEDDMPATLCMQRYLGGVATIDELLFKPPGPSGLTIRTFDPQAKQWSIYWVNSRTGKLDPIPTVGGFEGNRGEFYAEDKFQGRPIKVRYLWIIKDQNHARWEQAFSFDDQSWETNWTADFTRADAASLCEGGRVKR